MAQTSATPVLASEAFSGCALAYLVSQYPMLSMTFVIREVLQLRAMGFRIDTASINNADRTPAGLTADEAAEADRTFYVLAHGAKGALRAHLDAASDNPVAYLRGLLLVLKLGGIDLERLFLNAMYFTEALMVGAWMKRIGHQHLHAHLGSQAATVGLYVKQVFGFGFSVTVHGPDEFYEASQQYLTQKVIAADFICCISHFARSQLMKLSPYIHWHKLLVSRLGVNPSVFMPVTRTAEGRPFEILCVGRLVAAKGQHVLIEAVARLTQSGRSVILRLVGGGPGRASLEQEVAELKVGAVVRFEGPVNQDRIREFYGHADCFCIPSFAEGIPIVLMEAMAMEIPCVTTHITGIPELIRNGVDGLLVAPSDLDGLVEALQRLMDDPELRRRMGASGRQRVLQDYDLERNVGRLAGIFAERVAKTPAASPTAKF